MDGRIFFLKEELLKKLQHQWTIEEMAEIVQLSVPHFQKLFKVNTGMSPLAFLHDLGLEKAREYLETTFWQIQEVRIKVGFLDDSHFTRDFKKKYDVSPKEYRAQFWEKIQAGEQDGKK